MDLTLLVANALPILCVLCATVLAFRQREGWGWLLFIAVLTSSVPKAMDKIPTAAPSESQNTGSLQTPRS